MATIPIRHATQPLQLVGRGPTGLRWVALLVCAVAVGPAGAVAEERCATARPVPQPPEAIAIRSEAPARTPEAVELGGRDVDETGLEAPLLLAHPAHRRPRLLPGISAALAFDRSGGDPLGLQLPDPVRRRAPSAFAWKLEEESVRFLDTNPYALVPDELLEDDFVLDERRHAAERVLTRAAEAWFQEAVGLNRGRCRGTACVTSGFSAGLALDETPTWTFKKRGLDRGTRIDLPLTDSAFKFYRWRDLPSEDGGPSRISTSINVNPWDEEAWISLGLSF